MLEDEIMSKYSERILLFDRLEKGCYAVYVDDDIELTGCIHSKSELQSEMSIQELWNEVDGMELRFLD